MNTAAAYTDYVLGSNAAEYERLSRQASTLANCTERLFRDAGVAEGMRTLDVGCGVGEVTLLAAALVGRSGSVLGVDRDAQALARARLRVAAAGFSQAEFLDADIADLRLNESFDAIIGRFVLMFLPDPLATLRSLTALLRPGGLIVFQEPSWASFYALAGHLPLHTACADLVCHTFRRFGARPDMTLSLYQGLLDCGFQRPMLRVEVPMAHDAASERWLPDLVESLRPRFAELGVPTAAVGDLDTLATRLQAERTSARSHDPLVGLVGAWARIPR